MKLVLIHGRSQGGKDPVALQQQWEDAFEQGLQKAGLTRPPGTTIGFPFYADTLDSLVEQVDSPLVADVIAKGGSGEPADDPFRGELLAEIAAQSGVGDEEIQKHFGGQPHEKGPQNWEWVQSILKALDHTPLGGAAIDAFTRDVNVYLSYGNVRKKINQMVAPHVIGPCVVVAHSLGTVVAYNVLRDEPSDEDVRRFITVGSPLGLEAIKKKLKTPLTMPGCVDDWYNAYDERDVVALNPLDQKHFPVDPAIENKNDVDNFTDNRHGIAGYLSDADVARKIHEAMTAIAREQSGGD